jgi:hypothetical protein
VRDHYYDRKKKDTVVCLAGARSLLRPEKKKIQSSVYRRLELFFSGRNSGNYDRKKKSSAVVSVFGSGDYDRKKKSYSHLSSGLCCCVSFWFWREIGSFFLWWESFITTRKKSSILLWREKFITTGKKKL